MATVTVDRDVPPEIAAAIRDAVTEIPIPFDSIEVWPSPIYDVEVWVSGVKPRQRLAAALNRRGYTAHEDGKTLLVTRRKEAA